MVCPGISFFEPGVGPLRLIGPDLPPPPVTPSLGILMGVVVDVTESLIFLLGVGVGVLTCVLITFIGATVGVGVLTCVLITLIGARVGAALI